MKMFKKSLALLFALLLCCTAICSSFVVFALGEDNDLEDQWPGSNEGGEEGGEDAPTYKVGDLNNDGSVTLADCSLMARYLVKDTTLSTSDFTLEAMDVNGDDEYTLGDCSIVKRFLVKDPTLDAEIYELLK